MALTNYVIGTTAHAGGTWTIQDTNSATVGRYHDLALLMEGAASSNGFTTSRPGCLTGPTDSGSTIPNCWAQLPTGTGLNLNVRRGAAVVERGTLVGSYLVVSNATATVTLATANATNPRIDRVDLQVLDGALGDNGSVSQTALVVTSGTAAGSPTVPAAPANSIPICQILLPANTSTLTSGMVTDKRKSAALRGSVRVLLPGDSLSDVGFMAGELRDTTAIETVGTIERWDSSDSTWNRISDIDSLPVYTAHASTAGAVSAGVFANVAVDVADIDTDGMHSTNHAVIQRAGYYSVSGTIGYGTTTAAVRTESMISTTQAPTTTGIIKGTGDSQMSSTSIPTVGHMGSTPIHLNAGDTVWVMSFVNASGNFNTSVASPVATTLSIVCLSLD